MRSTSPSAAFVLGLKSSTIECYVRTPAKSWSIVSHLPRVASRNAHASLVKERPKTSPRLTLKARKKATDMACMHGAEAYWSLNKLIIASTDRQARM